MMNRKALLIVLSLLSSFSLSNCVAPGVAKGRNDAKSDIQAGKLGIETAGMPLPSDTTYARLLRKDYGIEFRPVAGCIPDGLILDHLQGYNAVMGPEIKRRFGADVLERTEQKAKALMPAPMRPPGARK